MGLASVSFYNVTAFLLQREVPEKYSKSKEGCAQPVRTSPDDWWSMVWLFTYLSVFPFTTPTPVHRSYPDLALCV